MLVHWGFLVVISFLCITHPLHPRVSFFLRNQGRSDTNNNSISKAADTSVDIDPDNWDRISLSSDTRGNTEETCQLQANAGYLVS